MSGCIYQGEFRPQFNSEEIWICEEPYAEYDWSEQLQKRVGRFIFDDKEYNVVYKATYGALMMVYTDDILQFGNYVDKYDPYELFRGRVNYEKNRFTLTVEEDKQNVFGGELPVMTFVKHNKEEYFKEKQQEE